MKSYVRTGISEIRGNLKQIISSVYTNRSSVVITHKNKPIAVLISVEDFQALLLYKKLYNT